MWRITCTPQLISGLRCSWDILITDHFLWITMRLGSEEPLPKTLTVSTLYSFIGLWIPLLDPARLMLLYQFSYILFQNFFASLLFLKFWMKILYLSFSGKQGVEKVMMWEVACGKTDLVLNCGYAFSPCSHPLSLPCLEPQVGCTFPTPQSASTNSMLSLVLSIDFLILESHFFFFF